MIGCKECNEYAQLIFSRGEIEHDEMSKLALDRHILKGCDNIAIDNKSSLILNDSSPEFRRGFIYALRVIQDLNKPGVSYESILDTIDSLIKAGEL